jgi:zinc protease
VTTQRWVTSAGSLVLSERSTVLPIVGISVSARTGALLDPKGKEGLSRLMTRAMRMGTGTLKSRALEERLDDLGAQLSMSSAQSYMHFGGVVVAHNLAPFVELLASLLVEPAFRPSDVRQVQREMSADLVALCDEDRTLCSRHFRRYAFGAHPYARPRSGTRASIASIERSHVIAQHARHITAENLVIGVWGDFVPRELERLLERCFGGLPRRKPPALTLPEPALEPGLRVLLVDKPERTQTQISIGTLGSSAHDRDHVALTVGNTVFGGLFTSRLNDEVRSKRGLSYGASSSLTISRTRDLWSMHTFPSAKDARACIELQLALYRRWVQRGITVRELAATTRYLVKGYAFEIDTASKRLDQHIDIEVMGWPKTHHSRFIERVKSTTVDQVNASLRRRLSLRDQVIVLVATADQMLPELERIGGIDHVEVVPFDDI